MAREASRPPAGQDESQPPDKPNQGGSKGKEKDDTSLPNRIQRSANMALNSLTGLSGDDGSTSGQSKGSFAVAEDRRRLDKTIGEASARNTTHDHNGQSIKAPAHNPSTEASFDQFQHAGRLPPIGYEEPVPGSDVKEQQDIDGDAVLRMLHDPPSESGLLEVFSPPEVDDMLAPDERSRLQKALFDSPRQGTQWAALLESDHDMFPRFNDVEGNEALFGTTENELARQQWLDQWHDVLTSYTDEVWGDLGPLAGEARAEVSRILDDSSRGQDKDHQALNRLRQVLAHLRD